jgi:hypothetical protein
MALAVIASASFLVPMSSNLTTSSARTSQVSSTGSASSTQVSTSQVSSTGSASSTQTSQVSTSQIEGNQGQLDVLLTDPPTVPAGVTGVYVTYSHVALHNDSGWIDTNAKGTIDLMKMVNASTTIAAVKVSVGVYNALRFNVSSAKVTYNNVNYTAFVPKAMLTVVVPGGINVTATKTSAALIDMHPTVVNIGSKSTPEFIVDVTASCYKVPASAITKDMDHWFRMSLVNFLWWRQINEQYTANIQITGAKLNSTFFSVTIKNTGSEDVNLSTISVTPLGSECVSPVTTTTASIEHPGLPLCFTGSDLFVVLSNGTLRMVPGLLQGGYLPMIAYDSHHANIFTDMGYKLATGHHITLNFTGSITFGFGGILPMKTQFTPPGVISGDQYMVTVVGPQALAEYVVVASK